MQSKNLVSVLIPAYNHEQYVQMAIKSVVNQTYRNIELIICDDCSSDNTWGKILDMRREAESRFVRFVALRSEKNEGICRTVNKMLSIVNGEYIVSFASDDFLFPEAIGVLYDFLFMNPDYVFAVGDNAIVDTLSNRVGWDENRNNVSLEEGKYKSFGDMLRSSRPDVNFYSSDFGSYESLLYGNYIPNAGMLRKYVLDKIGGYDENAPLEDWYMNMQMAKIGKFKYIDKVLCAYRWHNANTAKNSDKLVEMTKQTIRYERLLLQKNCANCQEFVNIYQKYRKNVMLCKMVKILCNLVPFPKIRRNLRNGICKKKLRQRL